VPHKPPVIGILSDVQHRQPRPPRPVGGRPVRAPPRPRRAAQQPRLLADLPQVIRDRYGLTPAWGAAYRRIRYNVMLKSLRTGHIFSITYDRSTAGHAAILVQAEIEYIRSRTLRTTSRNEILSQLTELVAWTQDLLASNDIAHTEDKMSKLTWLRQNRRSIPRAAGT
jgi:hypothetical protein